MTSEGGGGGNIHGGNILTSEGGGLKSAKVLSSLNRGLLQYYFAPSGKAAKEKIEESTRHGAIVKERPFKSDTNFQRNGKRIGVQTGQVKCTFFCSNAEIVAQQEMKSKVCLSERSKERKKGRKKKVEFPIPQKNSN